MDPSIKQTIDDVRNRLETDFNNLNLLWNNDRSMDETKKIKLFERMVAIRIQINDLPEEIKEDGNPSKA